MKFLRPIVAVILMIMLNSFYSYCQPLNNNRTINSIGLFPKEMNDSYLNLYVYYDQENIKFVSKIPIKNRSISFKDTTSVPEYYLLQNPLNNRFIAFLWNENLIIKIDSLDFTSSKPLNSLINSQLDSSHLDITRKWNHRAIWKNFHDSLKQVNLKNISYSENLKLKIREQDLINNSGNQYTNLMIQWICEHPKSIISLHLLRFNHLFLPQSKVDSVRKNVIDSTLKEHYWFKNVSFKNEQVKVGIGSRVPNFEIQLLNNKSITMKDLLGEIYILDFWGTWCKPCLEISPIIKRFKSTRHKRNCRIISIACEINTENANMNNFILEKSIDWEISLEKLSTGFMQKLFGIYVIPTLIVVDENGFIIDIASSKEEVEKLLVFVKQKLEK